ncbi:LytR/AlgR family response regulator transcription factor [Aquimarina algicola]|uniref:LytTR family transcriptional regulator n=1 Tax=Aquimarina algicola TaxID=2589995 RepID=A0A504IUQ9_9FLAO|nr:LytTR family DNA-binding domain-containing protein [Aquimarina algicola]TPN82066.1 LytTR family transcriptional regulator [Aquimarina algicola]
MKYSWNNRIEKKWILYSKYEFTISLLFSGLVLLLLVLFQPFEYRSYTLSKVLSDSFLSAVLVLLITFITRCISSYFIKDNTSNDTTNFYDIVNIIFDITIFLVLSFSINQFSGGFNNISYIEWFKVSIKYILVFEILFIPLSLFVRRYFLLHDIVDVSSKNDLFIPKSKEISKSLVKAICFTSEEEKIQLEISPDQVLMLKSSGNYIEVFYIDEEKVKSYLVRNTLSNINDKIKDYSFLFRCHRSYVININKIIKVKGNSRGYQISIDGIPHKIPVSRSRICLFNTVFNQE